MAQPLVIVCIYEKSVRKHQWSVRESMLQFLAIGQFEKRERPKVIAAGHRDAIIDCLYKNTNTGNVRP